MLGLRAALFVALGGVAALFSAAWGARLWRRGTRAPDDPDNDVGAPKPLHVGIGFLTDFLDTLGIGSFAVTTTLFRALRIVPDRLIPGTMIIGHALPTVVQSFIYVKIVPVDTLSLVVLVAASVAGAWLGAGIVSRWDRRKIQLVMGVGLIGAAGVMAARLSGLVPAGGETLGLAGVRLAIGLAGNFALGALMTIGIGAYGPSLILFGLLGMSPRAIFPIMMSTCAFIMTVPGLRFVGRGSYAARPALGLALGGIPGVLLAAFVVKQLDLVVLSWMVLAVVVYTAVAMLRAARHDTTAAAVSPEVGN